MASIEPWDKKVNDDRQTDVLNTFIIFCEDQNCEPIYFRSFSNDNTKIITIEEQGSGKLNLQKSTAKCKNDHFLEFRADTWKISDEFENKIWCVYDRDMEQPIWDQVVESDHLEFDVAISAAANMGFRVAWSNDAFELWILLHFEDVTPEMNKKHRDFIYERLTKIFKSFGENDLELGKITSNEKFNYRHSFKRRKHFLAHVLPRLKENADEAVKRATQLEKQFTKDVPFHQRNPCTLAHHLVNEIKGVR